ncbi:MAG TPA: hypothetical protein ENK85_11295 [Saprospiraceae bacterium]|nr:hypothetical protein [Saprospiraceae bacterium]
MKNKKYILVFLILLVVATGFGQSLCNPNGISTNPDNPVNPHSPDMTNNFFDWRIPDFVDYFDLDYLNNNPLPSTNPYWSTEDYLDYISGFGTDGNEIDYAPSEGWELISRGFGLFADGSTINNDFYSF